MFLVSPQFNVRHFLVVAILLLGISTPIFAAENSAAKMTALPQDSQSQELTSSGSVVRAVFTSQIIDREPADELTELSNDFDRIYFFTDLREMAGQIVTHQWVYAGKIMAEVKFKVGGGPRWRVYSSKNLLPIWTGEWTVSVIDENGSNLNVSTFNYVTAATGEKMPEANISTEPVQN